eukprot:scaffold80697_cov69-Phaeocystis_antarctica.AAC.7
MSAVATPSLVAEIRKGAQARVTLKQGAAGMVTRRRARHRHAARARAQRAVASVVSARDVRELPLLRLCLRRKLRAGCSP